MLQTWISTLHSYFSSRIQHLILLITSSSSFGRSKANQRTTFRVAQQYPTHEKLAARIPQGAWDSHMHVVDPVNYPLVSGAQYTPAPHPLSQAMAFESSVGIRNIVLVQPSIYGNDNTYMLQALRQLGPKTGRAVVTFDPLTISSSTLKEWDAIGVCGVRVNLQSVGKSLDSSDLSMLLHQYADIIRPFGWVLQLYVPLKIVEVLEKIVPDLRVKVCIDHFGHPALPAPSDVTSTYHKCQDPYTLPGFSSLINLLRQGSIYVKLSAPYRISKVTDQDDIVPVAKEILRVAGNKRVVFATDWPHTRFEGLDIRPYMEKVLEWCGDDKGLLDRLFRGNAEELWGVTR